MVNSGFSRYSVYRTVIEQVMRGDDRLPGLPSLTLKIRQAIGSDNSTTKDIANLVEQDPALCAMLMKYAASPLYKTARPPASIEGVLSLLGRQMIENIVMIHSVSSLFIMTNLQLKKLFKLAWKRLLTIAATSSVLADALHSRQGDQIMINSILSEIGSLAIISALKESQEVPDEACYAALCEEYGKSLSMILLRKWDIAESQIAQLRELGNWQKSSDNTRPDLMDIMNLGLQQAILGLEAEPKVPDIRELAAFSKLPPGLDAVNDDGQLLLLEDKQDKITTIINMMAV